MFRTLVLASSFLLAASASAEIGPTRVHAARSSVPIEVYSVDEARIVRQTSPLPGRAALGSRVYITVSGTYGDSHCGSSELMLERKETGEEILPLNSILYQELSLSSYSNHVVLPLNTIGCSEASAASEWSSALELDGQPHSSIRVKTGPTFNRSIFRLSICW